MRTFLTAVLTAVVVAAVVMYVLSNLLVKAWHVDDPGAKPQYRYTYHLDA